MKTKRILYLTLTKKWFDLIAAGIKKEEYREIKDFWTVRLIDREYDEVQFRNGYSPKSPWMRVDFRGVAAKEPNPAWAPAGTPKSYAVILGDVLEIKNYPNR